MAVRIIRKGGIWKNTEDEILKAAVMKYGKNQWARIASLLSRKTAKQCKSRWYEWLDPSIKKTEWTRDEEEKLLHMSKIMPMQWRTIAPIVGRTAAQCLEHYEKLLDAASGRDDFDIAEDPRRLRQGEIDPNPEVRPARPDQVDMEEDEKEMLQEARARLANTKGKKAKRKAREKQLEEARRLASLQKRRELKAAGISAPKPQHSRKKKGMDYNKEIPFQIVPAPGFHSVQEENNREREMKKNPKFKPVLLQQLEGERRDEIEGKLRKKDTNDKAERMKDPNASLAVNQKEQKVRRSNLMLPSPHLTETDLNQLSKMGNETEEADDDDAVTNELIGNYAQTPGAITTGPVTPGGYMTPAHGGGFMTPGGPAGAQTPRGIQRTPLQNRGQSLMAEVQNLRGLVEASTPLMGGDNTPMPQGLKPIQTPKQTPIQTPRSFPDNDGFSSHQVTENILSGLASLPTPKAFKASATPMDLEDENFQAGPKVQRGTAAYVVDEQDLEKQRQNKLKKEQDAKDATRSQVLKRDLPRPLRVNASFSKSKEEIQLMERETEEALEDYATELVKAEIVSMMTHDALVTPSKTVKAPEKVHTATFLSTYDQFTFQELKEANELLTAETDILKNAYGSYDDETFGETWEQCFADLIYIPHLKKFTLASRIRSQEAKAKSVHHEYAMVLEEMKRVSKKVQSLEKKATTYLGGYTAVCSKKEKEIYSLYQQIDEANTELECFKMMSELEQRAIPIRLEDIKTQVEIQRHQEKELQEKYQQLLNEKVAASQK